MKEHPTMSKLFSILIALAAIGPPYADTLKSTFDFGPAFPERLAFVMFTCKTCHGAQSININGIELKRDVTTGGAEVAEIWSAPLPDGSGDLAVTITSDHALNDADVGMGAANAQPAPKLSMIEGAVKGSAAGRREYSLSVENGDVVVSVSRGGNTHPRPTPTPPPSAA